MDETVIDAPDHGALYLVAEQQAGYFSTAQTRQVGFSRSLLSYHVDTGRFVRVKPHVYRLAEFPAFPHEDLYVAWLQVGPHAVISHESALALYDLSDVLPTRVHLTVPRTTSRRRRGIQFHTKQLTEREVTHFAGLSVTTVPRTLADVTAAGLADEQVRLAIHQAVDRGLVTRAALLELAAQRNGRLEQLIAASFEEDEPE